MRKFGAALAMGVILVTSACGGSSGGGGRPSVDDVSKALTKSGSDSLLGSAASQIDDKAAKCIAKALVDSKISDGGLRALVKHDKSYKPSSSDEKAIAPVSAKLTKCITDNIKTP